jgi:hypothetical protein
MFSFTGKYPQLTFNLGNRVTVYGSLLITYLIVLMPLSKSMKTIVFAVMIFTILGISNHWKMWNIQQQEVIANIQNNKLLNEYQDNKVIYVSGNQYSKYGPISHIEFLSESWVTGSVFRLALKKEISVEPINKRHVYENGYMVDTKNNTKAEVNDYINVYDSENDRLFTLNVEEINSYIDSLTPENRHWIQLLSKDNYLRKIVLFLMPRLKYAF